MAFDLEKIRSDFPMLGRTVHGKPLVFLDSAATALKPQAVIDAESEFYAHDYGTVRRGIYALSQEATARYEGVRERSRAFLNAADVTEIVFTRGTTEAINLVAGTLGRTVLKAGDHVLVTAMEHHANIVSWQIICKQVGASLSVIPIDDSGQLVLSALDELLTERVKIVALAHMSNVLGTVNPVAEVARRAHAIGAKVLVDGAQSAAHMPVDVQALDCDFYVCSSHKMCGPTGIGVLYGRRALLDIMPPWQGGGDMIATVSFEETTFESPPYRFEAGTPPIAQVMAFGAALDYLDSVGRDEMQKHEHALTTYATTALTELGGVRIFGSAPGKGGIIAFVVEGTSPFDVGTLLDEQGVAIRVGHHCAQPLMKRLGVASTARASFGVYSSTAEVDALIAALAKAKRVLA
jgi:cysteine desulfurase/selenocysteine lyase